MPREIVEEVARDFDLHQIDPMAQAVPPVTPVPSNGNGVQAPLVESLLHALNTLVERLNSAEINVEHEKEKEAERKP